MRRFRKINQKARPSVKNYLKSSKISLKKCLFRGLRLSGHLVMSMVSFPNILTSHQGITMSSCARRSPKHRRFPNTIRHSTIAVEVSTVKSHNLPIFAPVLRSIMSLRTRSDICIFIFTSPLNIYALSPSFIPHFNSFYFLSLFFPLHFSLTKRRKKNE